MRKLHNASLQITSTFNLYLFFVRVSRKPYVKAYQQKFPKDILTRMSGLLYVYILYKMNICMHNCNLEVSKLE